MNTSITPLIFIVEDNTIYGKLILAHLRAHQLLRTEIFKSGEECLKNLFKKPDIIIQDYLLDGIDGIEVLKETKKKCPETEFIFLSGQDNIQIAIKSIQYGATDYIVKDKNALEKVLAKIQKIVARQEISNFDRKYKAGLKVFFIALAFIVLIFLSLTILYPNTFPIHGR